jgi:hypothetical protein
MYLSFISVALLVRYVPTPQSTLSFSVSAHFALVIISFLILVRFFFSPEDAAAFLSASFFSAGASPAVA